MFLTEDSAVLWNIFEEDAMGATCIVYHMDLKFGCQVDITTNYRAAFYV